MLIFKRFTPYWTAALATLVLLLGIQSPEFWPWVVAVLVVIPIVAAIIVRDSSWRLEYLGLSVSQIMLLVGGYGFMLIQEELWLIWFILAIIIAEYFLFIKHLVVYRFDPAKYVAHSLEHVAQYNNVVTSFFMYASLFMFYTLGITRLRFLIIYAAIATLLLVWQTFWIQKMTWQRTSTFVFAISLVMVQLFWTLHFWPNSFYVTGGLLAIALYAQLHLTRLYLEARLSRRAIIRYGVTAGLAIALLLSTAQWSF